MRKRTHPGPRLLSLAHTPGRTIPLRSHPRTRNRPARAHHNGSHWPAPSCSACPAFPTEGPIKATAYVLPGSCLLPPGHHGDFPCGPVCPPNPAISRPHEHKKLRFLPESLRLLLWPHVTAHLIEEHDTQLQTAHVTRPSRSPSGAQSPAARDCPPPARRGHARGGRAGSRRLHAPGGGAGAAVPSRAVLSSSVLPLAAAASVQTSPTSSSLMASCFTPSQRLDWMVRDTERAPSFSFPTCRPRAGARAVRWGPAGPCPPPRSPAACPDLGLPLQGPAAREHLAQAVPVEGPHGFEGLHAAVGDGLGTQPQALELQV